MAPAPNLDIVYVLVNADKTIAMATTNNAEAYAYYRDVPNITLEVFINKNRLFTVSPDDIRTKRSASYV